MFRRKRKKQIQDTKNSNEVLSMWKQKRAVNNIFVIRKTKTAMENIFLEGHSATSEYDQ